MKSKKKATKRATVGKGRNSYDPAKIEKKWQKKWAASKIYASKEGTKEKFYALDMFPYPSGEGLHVGHPKGYIATDVVSRMQRMQGKNVLHPMGFDAFGLPAENYALKTKTNPEIAVRKNVARYKQQLELLGFDYDWSREVNTTDPKYYKWTQWIFLQLLKKGLAYESYEPVNWCPKDKTVLANEDVENGRCERCGTPVEKKPMRQWVLKITKYADRLLRDLDAKTLPIGDIIETVNGEPCFNQMREPGKVRPDLPFVERDAIEVIVKHWSEDKYIGLKWKKVKWNTLITGGIEPGQTAVEAAIAEIREETGYLHPEFKKQLGFVHAKFFHVPKNQNRLGHFPILYFELKDGEKEEVAPEEKAKHDVVWVPKNEMAEFLTAAGQRYSWSKLIGSDYLSAAKPLLDWPESIKEAQRNWIGRSEGAEIDFRLTMFKNKPRFVLIHGFEGSAHTNFFPWLKKELEGRGHEVEAPELPNSNRPKESEQVEYVLKNCHFDEHTVIVAHSLGGVVAMNALMKLNKPVSGLVLVAPAIDSKYKHAESRPFWEDFSWDFDYEQIKKLTSGRIAVLSDLTEKFRIDYLKYLSKELDALLIETKAKDEHFCADVEPEILKSVTPTVSIFTTRPDTLFGVTYLVLAPEHPWVKPFLDFAENRAEVEAYISKSARETEIERTDETKEKTGVELKNIRAVNPANNEEVPVWISDYVLADYGTGAVMAVPAHDERDSEFAKKFGLPVRHVVAESRTATTTDIAFRPNEPVINRRCIRGLVKHWSEDKYIVLHWKDTRWNTLVSGGIDGSESPADAAKREITEETGYTDMEFVSLIGGPVHAKFFAPHKQQNREDLQQGIVFKLKSANRIEVAEEEKKIHDIEWVTFDELRKLTAESLVDSVLVHRFENSEMAYTGNGVLMNSGRFDGYDSESAKKEIVASVDGKWVTKYKLRDWVFSRQRYWGEPIPVIHCPEHGAVPVPEKDLPVVLPHVKSYEPTGTGESPLAAIKKWVNVKCPICKGPARRETNTMPQWAGSCWYYLRYEDPKNAKKLVDAKKERYWSPVDLYVGGAEHATRHLIYARFWHKFLYDIGVVSSIEPFAKLQNVGLIMGEDGRKMSKRFGNVINPDDIVKRFGADTLRIYEMFMGPFSQQIAWSTDGMVGSRRFIERVWRLRDKIGVATAVDRVIHKTTKKVTEDIQSLRFNTAISSLMIAVNELEKAQSLSRAQFESLLKLLAPFAPHVTEELWSSLGNKKSIHISSWPSYDPALAADEEDTIIVQVDGKVRASFKAPTGLGKDELLSRAKALPELKKWLEGRSVKMEIAVPGRLVNIVLTN